jgi:hypothetical protein
MAQRQSNEQCNDAETLRLIRAFYKVRDRNARRIILAVVEAAAKGALVKIEEPTKLGRAIADWSSAGENTQH